ncbi:hypothetical protein D3C76_1520850 [compost metagenome]
MLNDAKSRTAVKEGKARSNAACAQVDNRVMEQVDRDGQDSENGEDLEQPGANRRIGKGEGSFQG